MAAIVIHPEPLLGITLSAALAATLAAVASERGLIVPAVVLELVLGVVIGPHGLGIKVDSAIQFFSNLGLALLFFFAGYEIDVARIRGRPMRLGLIGWVCSLALGYSLAGLLALAGVVISALYTGSALTTTALGTLIPILSDAGELRSRFGALTVAAGAVGEFGPILILTLILSAEGTLHNALILIAFLVVAVLVAFAVSRASTRTLPMFERTLESSSQLAVRWILVLIFALVVLAFHLGLDLLLGGFAAGVIARRAIGDRDFHVFNSKLTAIAFGVFVPVFFIVSGMTLDLPALFASIGGVLKLVLFFVLFLTVRGAPVLVLYRGELARRDRFALAFMCSTQLPLVLAITALATAEHHMLESTAAALVGGAVLSTLVFPAVGLRLRGDLDARSPLETSAAGGERPAERTPAAGTP